MDVHCSTCGEPWDVYHLRHEAIFETNLDLVEAEDWIGLGSSERLNSRYREKFKEVGYEFGSTVINVMQCPCCPKDAKPNTGRVQTKSALEELLGNDEDGLASIFEDYRL